MVRETRHGVLTGQRVELNAMDSGVFIAWLEAKLESHGVTKLIPDKETIKVAWQHKWQITQLNKAIATAFATISDAPEPPDDIVQLVTKTLGQYPDMSWDQSLDVESS